MKLQDLPNGPVCFGPLPSLKTIAEHIEYHRKALKEEYAEPQQCHNAVMDYHRRCIRGLFDMRKEVLESAK